MSQLEDLLNNAAKFPRLNLLSGHSPVVAPGDAKNFSVREQSGGPTGVNTIRQNAAVNFMDAEKKIQDEFTVGESANTLSTLGIRKSNIADRYNSKFTDAALSLHVARNMDVALTEWRTYKLHPYKANTSSTWYKTKNASSQGILLAYNPA